MKTEEQEKLVIESLKLLAMPLQSQKDFLNDFVDVPDDVISNFENAFLVLPILIENDKFTNNFIASVLRLNNKIKWCLRNIELDDFENSEWNKVRIMSNETLKLINNNV